jgi:DNA repair exonuclease SbcCD nuclease subunit
MKILLVGDVHAVPDELDDCRALIGLVARVALENSAEVLFLGDQYHSHSLIRSEVLWFWREAFSKLTSQGTVVRALVGNHDYSGTGQTLHSMISHEHQITIIDKPTDIGPVRFLPYYDDHEAFVRDANSGTAPDWLICHQTFEGAKYEGGFYATDGIKPELLNYKQILSGHIHTPFNFEVPNGPEVTYIGAPRWRTASDANVERAIWLYEFDGKEVRKTPFNTGTTCRQIRMVTDTPKLPVQLPLDPGVDWRVDIHGPVDWIEARKSEFSGVGAKIRTFPVKVNKSEIRESEGISAAFRSYLSKFTPKFGTPTETLLEMSSKRLSV